MAAQPPVAEPVVPPNAGLFIEAVTQNQNLIHQRLKRIGQLQSILDGVLPQYITVNTFKTVSAVGSVVGAVMLFFPPTAVAGGITLASSGGVGLVTTGSDIIADAVKNNQFTAFMEKDIDEQKTLKTALERLREALAVENSDHTIAFDGEKICGGVAGVAKVGGGVVGIVGAVEVAEGAAVGGATRAVALSSTQVWARVLGPIGAAVAVGDAVWSWCQDSPTKEAVIKAKEQLEDCVMAQRTIQDRLQGIAPQVIYVSTECCICLEPDSRDRRILSCGHACVCMECRIPDAKCPLCRSNVQELPFRTRLD